MFSANRRLRLLLQERRPTLPVIEATRLPEQLRRLKRLGPVRVFLTYHESQVGDHAAGLAFHALLTMFPIFLGLLTVLGLVTRSADLDVRVQQVIITTFPSGMQVELRNALLALRHAAGAYGLVAVAWLLWSGTGYFAHLEWAMNRIYISRNRSFWMERLMGLGMICALSTSIVAAVVANWVLASFAAPSVLGFIANWLVLTLLLLSMYWVVPNRRVSVGESWPGAVLAGLSIQILNLAFPLYLHFTHNLNAFGRGFLLFLVMVSWPYLVSQLILLGAVVNRLQMGRIPAIGRSHEITSPFDS